MPDESYILTRTIEELTRMLESSAQIIRRQAELLALHEIQTANGDLEQEQAEFLDKCQPDGILPF